MTTARIETVSSGPGLLAYWPNLFKANVGCASLTGFNPCHLRSCSLTMELVCKKSNWSRKILVQSGMSDSPVTARAGASLLGKRLLPWVQQHSALCTLYSVSRRFDLHGATNTQQLRRQNFCSRWTSVVELSSSPAVQSRHHLLTVQMTAEGTPFSWSKNMALWLLICGDLEKHLLTYLLTVGDPSAARIQLQKVQKSIRQRSFTLCRSTVWNSQPSVLHDNCLSH